MTCLVVLTCTRLNIELFLYPYLFDCIIDYMPEQLMWVRWHYCISSDVLIYIMIII